MTEEDRYRIVIGDFVFQGRPLSPDKSLDLWAKIADKLVAALDTIDPKDITEDAGALAAVVKGSAKLLALTPELRPFLEIYTFDLQALDPSRSGQTPIKPWLDKLFAGRPEMQATLLVAAAIAEYQGFFVNGRSIFEALAARFGFLRTFADIGRSGESS